VAKPPIGGGAGGGPANRLKLCGCCRYPRDYRINKQNYAIVSRDDGTVKADDVAISSNDGIVSRDDVIVSICDAAVNCDDDVVNRNDAVVKDNDGIVRINDIRDATVSGVDRANYKVISFVYASGAVESMGGL
jgi:hypothetical protein